MKRYFIILFVLILASCGKQTVKPEVPKNYLSFEFFVNTHLYNNDNNANGLMTLYKDRAVLKLNDNIVDRTVAIFDANNNGSNILIIPRKSTYYKQEDIDLSQILIYGFNYLIKKNVSTERNLIKEVKLENNKVTNIVFNYSGSEVIFDIMSYDTNDLPKRLKIQSEEDYILIDIIKYNAVETKYNLKYYKNMTNNIQKKEFFGFIGGLYGGI